MPSRDSYISTTDARRHTLDDYARLFSGIRLEILECLSAGPRDVGSIATELELGMPTISTHLSILRDHGLLERERIKTRHIYAIRRDLCKFTRSGQFCIKLSTASGRWIVVGLLAE